MQMHRVPNSLHSRFGRSVREGNSMTKFDEIERGLAMSEPALYVFLIGFWHRTPGLRGWEEFVGLVVSNVQIETRPKHRNRQADH
jgi:hypothetical protein